MTPAACRQCAAPQPEPRSPFCPSCGSRQDEPDVELRTDPTPEFLRKPARRPPFSSLAWGATKFVCAAACVIALVAVGVFGVTGFTHKKNGTSPDAVASMINADYCDNSGYYLVTKIDNSKQTIYDCTTASKTRCVTVFGNIANDSTEEVRAVFANTLGVSKPACIA